MRSVPIVRRGCYLLGVAAILLSSLASVHAQDYPSRSVRILVGAPPGGSTDIIARLMAQKLGDRLGQAFVVENRAGANMIIASEAAARAAPDGYTLIMVPSNHVINGGLYKSLSYDPIKDFAPIARLANLPLMLLVHPSLPVNDVNQLIAYAKSKNGDLAYSSSGIGSPHHLGIELLMFRTGIKMTHVPFKGAADAMTETLAGRTPVGIFTVPPVLPHVKSGKLRGIASAGTRRVESLPDMPTIAESGVAGFGLDVWLGMLAPAGTPKAVVDKLNRELVDIVNSAEVQAQLRAGGFEPAPSTSDEFLTVMRNDLGRYKEIAKASGATLD
jgi:tripartite-type tricarboxylate transporter receptor subunit TctC